MQGILLILIAGFIIALVNQVVNTTPESHLVFERVHTTTTVVATTTSGTVEIAGLVARLEPEYSGVCVTPNCYWSVYYVDIPPPPAGYKYMIVFQNDTVVLDVEIVTRDYKSYYPHIEYNGTHVVLRFTKSHT